MEAILRCWGVCWLFWSVLIGVAIVRGQRRFEISNDIKRNIKLVRVDGDCANTQLLHRLGIRIVWRHVYHALSLDWLDPILFEDTFMQPLHT